MKLIKESAGLLGKLAVTSQYYKTQPTKGLVWFLHGTCDSGPGLQSWLRTLLHQDFNFYNQQVLYPTAPLLPYDLLNGQVTCVWYNRLKLSPDFPEDLGSIERTSRSLGKLIIEESERLKIPLSKVVVGGFSQGGNMALHLAYRLYPEVAGCFALSSFLPPDSRIYHSLEKMTESIPGEKSNTANAYRKNEPTLESQSQAFPQNQIPFSSLRKSGKLHFPVQQQEASSGMNVPTLPSNISSEQTTAANQVKLPPLFMSHGTHDPLVLHSWGRSTFRKLLDHGVPGHFYTVPKLEHTMNHLQLHVLHNWIDGILQDKPKNKISKDSMYGGQNKRM